MGIECYCSLDAKWSHAIWYIPTLKSLSPATHLVELSSSYIGRHNLEGLQISSIWHIWQDLLP